MKLSKYNATKLLQHLQSIAPIESVSIVDENDKNSWRIGFKPESSDSQKIAAQNALLSYIEPSDITQLEIEDILDLLVKKNILMKKDVDDARSMKKEK
jgi:hypothetical protein